MRLKEYKDLISNMPVLQQSFSTKRKTWEKYNELSISLREVFGDSKEIVMSRREIFKFQDSFDLKILKIILWGYPRGMRGGNFTKIWSSKHDLSKFLVENRFYTLKEFNKVINQIKDIKGLGISTISKFFYFFKIKVEGLNCQILDDRIMNIISNQQFEDFKPLGKIRRENALKKYFEYLKMLDDCSQKLKVPAENIEQFLFVFGNHLKED